MIAAMVDSGALLEIRVVPDSGGCEDIERQSPLSRR
jgi:hypothetical protein